MTSSLQEYVLTDHEASVLLPHLVERLGHNNTSMRSLMREVLREIHLVYDPKKTFAWLVQGLFSANKRSFLEASALCPLLRSPAVDVTGAFDDFLLRCF